ncbi:nucleotidyl transferase AbiEii/AbiGii toxin family protein [Nocardiopsis sp. FR6]|uniref:nucleotidyl transferase AbiEii/AbiGii toxin family protein n=1 Tax=Nocardiopsis sp. FR6 TaxID=2605986 RepID=UPI00135BCF14|nr:nucleotidyl transferase AbiEii/AbiGii toxin family protein [Nocardiopsis sp. FR6]
MEFSGSFEIHLTLAAPAPGRVAEAAEWARRHGLKFTHIELDRGESPSQPMVTYHADRSTLERELAVAERWSDDLARAGFPVVRTKVEVDSDNDGVPRSREAAERLPESCYFETHVKLLLPEGADLAALSAIVEPLRARLSRNARRVREDGLQERFVTQRCSRVGRREARRFADALFRALQAAGVSFDRGEGPRPRVLSVESEFVVHDSALSVDAGWMGAAPVRGESEVPSDVYSPGSERQRHPDTFVPNTRGPEVRQEKVFDPALKHLDFAFGAGEPVFADPGTESRWWEAHRRAMELALRAIAGTPWREHLVLRGSMLMPVWAGGAARRPRDLDFVVVPAGTAPFGDPADRMFADLVEAVTGAAGDGIAFDADGVALEGIWTYDRVPGRRLVVPWRAGGLPPGTVQVDAVFHESLPEPPVTVAVAGTEVLAASAELSLAWKVLWLYTDTYPQGKDLYDAVLLAENATPSRELLVTVLRRELGERAEAVDERHLRDGDAFASDAWEHFVRDCPWVAGGPDAWLDRFEAALAPAFRRG